jgi:hypothetical protein
MHYYISSGELCEYNNYFLLNPKGYPALVQYSSYSSYFLLDPRGILPSGISAASSYFQLLPVTSSYNKSILYKSGQRRDYKSVIHF